MIDKILKEARWIKADIEPSLERALALIDHEDKDFLYKLKAKITEKFSDVGKNLRSVLKPASKGERKGLLIFVPDAPRKIQSIQDGFTKYIVRAIYDGFSTGTGKWQAWIHMNDLFNSSFIGDIIVEINERLTWLEEQKKIMGERQKNERSEHYEKGRAFENNYERKGMGSKNVFNTEKAKPFFEAREAFRAKVKKEHPRVPDDKLTKYINENYSYRNEYEKLKEDFLMTLPEYVEFKKEKDTMWANHSEEYGLIRKQVEEEKAKFDWDRIRKIIEGMIDIFVKNVANSIIKGEINFPTEVKVQVL